MSLSATIRAQGFATALKIGGEDLLLMSRKDVVSKRTGLVKRAPSVTAPLERGQVDHEERNKTFIEFEACCSEQAPKIGQVFKDMFGVFHRISKIQSTEISFYCTCEPSEADEDE